MSLNWHDWYQRHDLVSKNFVCGFCGLQIGSSHGYYLSGNEIVKIYLCTNCGNPTYFNEYGLQYPGPMLGREINNLPENIKSVYGEIREDIKNNSFTSALLLGRKLIMHIAVDIAKAIEGLSFVKYIEHLKNSGYISPNGDKCLEYIRELGNEKNHEIKIGTEEEEAKRILKFIEILLIFMYEFPEEFNKEESSSAERS